MKKILIALSLLLSVYAVDAQVKSPADAQKAVESAKAAAENPKKAEKVATWLKLANAYIDAYAAPAGNVWVGAGQTEVRLMLGNEKPVSVENVTLSGEAYTKEVYANKNLYFNQAGVLALIEVTKPVFEDALPQALNAYVKAYEVDLKKSKEKDVVAGLRNIAAKYLDEGMNKYMFGDLAGASAEFEKAAEASATAPSNAFDSIAVYNAGFTAYAVNEYARAKGFFEQCIANNYYADGGDAFAKLADCYLKLEDKDAAKNTLETGFKTFPQSQSILIGLINFYIESGDDTDRLFVLLDEAKKNEPNNASLYYVEGNIRNQLGQIDEAVTAYNKSYEINPEYEFGLIGIGIMYYNQAVDLQDKAANEMDDAKYTKLVEEFEAALMNAIEPFEKAYEVSKDQNIKVNIAEYLKNIYYRFRTKGTQYEEGYNKYNAIVAENR